MKANMVRGSNGVGQVAYQSEQMERIPQERNGLRCRAGRARAGLLEPLRIILGARDSLVLSAEQDRKLTELHAYYLAASDSIWQQLGNYLAELPDNYSETAAIDSARQTRAAAYRLLEETTREVRSTLTPDQLAMLAPELLQLMDEKSMELRARLDLSYF